MERELRSAVRQRAGLVGDGGLGLLSSAKAGRRKGFSERREEMVK